jgi:pectin methylesterase-like acyl-CoA thioesterase
MLKTIRSIFLLLPITVPAIALVLGTQTVSVASRAIVRIPADKARSVNPDTHLAITFPGKPALGNSGQIRIYDAADNRLVDTLDMSIPPGPTKPTLSPTAVYTPVPYEYVSGRFTNANTKPGTPSGGALPTPDDYQLTIIGGFTDGFHFYPVIIHDNTAAIYPHNNLLQYDTTYYVQIDPGVLTLKDGGFKGISGIDGWRFTTKKRPPRRDAERLVVSADGSGDFSTVQGAMDFIPDSNPKRVTVFVRNGTYEEIVYFRNKTNVTILGEDRDKVVVFYANSEVFNPHPINLKTNEVPGTFPSRRAAFAVDHCRAIHLVNLTIKTTAYGQAEGLLLNGEEMIVSHVNIVGSGDALQSNGSAYFVSSDITGDGDTILGRGPAFFQNCELSSMGPYMWIRNTSANHGNVFVSSIFKTRGNQETVIARAPTNGGKDYPYAEAVLIDCVLSGISPAGWGEVGGNTSNMRYWEYHSTAASDGKPVDVSRRHPASRQLSLEKDADVIANYRDPAYVLGGWVPQMAPLILSQPEPRTVQRGQTATFTIKAAAVPEANYQWFRDGKRIAGATNAELVLKNAGSESAGAYVVAITNKAGSVSSNRAKLRVK